MKLAPPDSLLVPCPQKYGKPIQNVGDIIAAKDAAEGALAVCSAQIDAVRKWKAESIPSSN